MVASVFYMQQLTRCWPVGRCTSSLISVSASCLFLAIGLKLLLLGSSLSAWIMLVTVFERFIVIGLMFWSNECVSKNTVLLVSADWTWNTFEVYVECGIFFPFMSLGLGSDGFVISVQISLACFWTLLSWAFSSTMNERVRPYDIFSSEDVVHLKMIQRRVMHPSTKAIMIVTNIVMRSDLFDMWMPLIWLDGGKWHFFVLNLVDLCLDLSFGLLWLSRSSLTYMSLRNLCSSSKNHDEKHVFEKCLSSIARPLKINHFRDALTNSSWP